MNCHRASAETRPATDEPTDRELRELFWYRPKGLETEAAALRRVYRAGMAAAAVQSSARREIADAEAFGLASTSGSLVDRSATCMVPPANCRQRLQREGKPYPRSGCEACGDMSPLWRQCNAGLEIEAARPAFASSLVDQVAILLAKPGNCTWDGMAVDVIREVAAWLRDRGFTWVAQVLEKEANRD